MMKYLRILKVVLILFSIFAGLSVQFTYNPSETISPESAAFTIALMQTLKAFSASITSILLAIYLEIKMYFLSKEQQK